ncbi:MAG: UDP-N-acetylmuramoyl-L-alanine--D-glutamate ligase [Pseudomonadota bacterium]
MTRLAEKEVGSHAPCACTRGVSMPCVAVMGLGVSGRSAVRYLTLQGVRVLVSDARGTQQLSTADRDFLAEYGVEYECGSHTLAFLQQADKILVSPGIRQDLEILQQLRALKVPVLGELAVVAPLINKPVVAITGTNGKTTVTALIGELLQGAGKKVFVGGNIGTSIFDYLNHPEDVDVLVLELSSFQLESAGDFKADVAILLNVTPDHLDRHGSMDCYAAAKMKIFFGQGQNDTAILSGDDHYCREMLPGLGGGQRQLLFGHGRDCQARIEDHSIILSWQGRKERYDLTGSMLDTATGALNSAAAILAVRSLGCGQELIAQGLAAFQVAAHRMAFVGKVAGVSYYDDSKATNTGAVLSALENFKENVILIAGGRDKGDDYSLLQESVRRKVRCLILIGEAAELIARALTGMTELRKACSMEEAVLLAASIARAGDTVLLSPACASFDMFESYGHRGRVFAAAVQKLIDQSGAVLCQDGGI